MIGAVFLAALAAPPARALELEGYIDLPEHRGAGGFDHADVSPAERLLFVAHTANDSIEVVDLAAGRLVESMQGYKGVAGVLAGGGRVFTSNRGEDTVSLFAPDRTGSARIPLGGRPNGLALNAGRGFLLVGLTAPPYAVVTIDVKKRSIAGRALVPGRTRWAVYDPGQSLFFVNIADPPVVVAIDPLKPAMIARTYPVPAAGPHGLALDPATGRLLVACDGKKVVSLDARSGKVMGEANLTNAPDVVVLDQTLRRLYVAVGDPGVIDVLDVDRMVRIDTITTEAGAHTIAFDADQGKVYAFLPRTHRAAVFATSKHRAASSPPLDLVQKIALPGVAGRIDHLAIDLKRQRMFVAALGNGTLEVLDLAKGSRIRSVGRLQEPQGVVHLPDFQRVVVATGGGAVVAFDDTSLEERGRTDGLADADNVRYDSRAKRLYVGYGQGALAIIDARTMRRLGEIKVPGHPESFRLEEGSPLAYVNMPATKEIVVLDREKKAVISTMPLGSHAANFPMALDEPTHRLFIGTRTPPRVVVADSQSHPIADVECVGDTDDLFYDPVRQLLYVTGGEGFVDVLDARQDGGYRRMARVPTAPGARTSLWVPELRRLYVAAPARDGLEAAILVFEARP